MTVQYATFRAGQYWLGIDVLQVQEVLREQTICPVPLSPHTVCGLMNLRGQIVPALNVHCILGLPSAEAAPTSVVIRTADGLVSLQADEAGDVLEAEESALQGPPAGLHPQIRERMLGVQGSGQGLLLVMDPQKMARLPEQQSF